MIGVYAFLPDMRGQHEFYVDYIGMSKNVEERIKKHFRTGKEYALKNSGHIIYQQCSSIEEAARLESSLIYRLSPRYNKSNRRQHRIRYPHFYEVKSIEAVANHEERKPWDTRY